MRGLYPYEIKRSTLERRKLSAHKGHYGRRRSVLFKNIVIAFIGLAIGCAVGPSSVNAVDVPTPQAVFRVAFGPFELEELERRIQEMQYLYPQAMAIKTGLLDVLEPAIKSGKEALQDIKALNPRTHLNKDLFASGDDYINALSNAMGSSKKAKQEILTLMNERYADIVSDEKGNLKTKHTPGSLPYFADYQREALDAIQKTLAQMAAEDEGSLAQLMHINNQILLNQGVMMTHLLEAIADQNRILTIMVGNNMEVMQ